MKVPLETEVPRIKFLPGDSDEARNTATGHSCKTLAFIKKERTHHDIKIDLENGNRIVLHRKQEWFKS